MGKVHRVQVIVEIEADNEPGILTRYEVIGKPGDIYSRRTRIGVTPHYGNPGEPATQVEVSIDAMLIPIGRDQLISITEEPLDDHELEGPAVSTVIARQLPPGRSGDVIRITEQ
ncbi:hypothetical protein HOT31_gp045 [Microbacterium phage Hendrix]|uniref:Uncharacterized protein n=1 Tax=Microbacterium phage Hendrix TaxID=2182341 RepID=A0A2U8UUN2_9CAUD|nr:hypothetical protein HOT31_gp045 [Microbacterium phage Hendrix]AWN07716.1 hypothetical protein PBI_HENDRIX_45 [Microbacterium phage Hendrix]